MTAKKIYYVTGLGGGFERLRLATSKAAAMEHTSLGAAKDVKLRATILKDGQVHEHVYTEAQRRKNIASGNDEFYFLVATPRTKLLRSGQRRVDWGRCTRHRTLAQARRAAKARAASDEAVLLIEKCYAGAVTRALAPMFRALG